MTMDYSMEKCYEVYKGKCRHQNKVAVSSDKFRSIFFEDFNIKYRQPTTDTCTVCDSISVSFKNAELNTNGEVLKKLKMEQNLHHRQI